MISLFLTIIDPGRTVPNSGISFICSFVSLCVGGKTLQGIAPLWGAGAVGWDLPSSQASALFVAISQCSTTSISTGILEGNKTGSALQGFAQLAPGIVYIQLSEQASAHLWGELPPVAGVTTNLCSSFCKSQPPLLHFSVIKADFSALGALGILLHRKL